MGTHPESGNGITVAARRRDKQSYADAKKRDGRQHLPHRELKRLAHGRIIPAHEKDRPALMGERRQAARQAAKFSRDQERFPLFPELRAEL